MATKRILNKYVTIGLRQDRNFSDISDPTVALNNLLNNLVNDGDSTEFFISDDLDAIRGIKNTLANREKLSLLAGQSIKYSIQVTDPVSGSLSVVETLAYPRITLKDRIDNVRNITGLIPSYLGGTGLTARYIDSTDVNTGSKTSSGSTIFNFNDDPVTGQKKELFWLTGDFKFGSVLDITSPDQYGGIQWTGYFSQMKSNSPVSITIKTTGLLIFEYDVNDTGNWVTSINIYNDSRTLNVAVPSNSTIVTLQAGETIFVGEGDIVETDDSTLITVVEVDHDNNTITLSEAYSVTTSINVRKILGETQTVSKINLPFVEYGKQIKIRISYWYPNNNQSLNEKSINFEYLGGLLFFYHMYPEKPNPVPGEFEIRNFLLNAVTPYQTNVGESLGNKKLTINGSFISVYSPPSSLSQIKKAGPVNVSFSNGNNLVSVASNVTIENGDYIVPVSVGPSEIDNLTQVKMVYNTTEFTATKNFTSNGTESVIFIDHKGLVLWTTAVSAAEVVTVSDTSMLRVGYIVVTSNTTNTDYKHITKIISSTQFETNSNLSLTGTEIIYIYGDKGLIDKTKDTFCQGVFGQVLNTTANVGSTSLILKSVTGIEKDQVVQYEPGIPQSTTVTHVDKPNLTITISNPLTNQILASSTIVFAPEGTVVNKEGCILPLDNSPPFVGISTGLSTSGKKFKSSSEVSIFTVNADNFSAIVNSGDVTTVAGTPQFNRKIRINNNYSILGTT